MAEINIQKKKKPVWPWFIGILAAAIVIWIVVEVVDDEEITRDRTEMVGFEQEAAEIEVDDSGHYMAVEEYSSFVEDNADTDAMGLDHEYTANGIRLLSEALSSIVDRIDADVNMQQKKEDLRNKADEIQKDPMSTQHANIIKDAFTSSADLMQDLQKNHFTTLQNDVDNVQEAAEAVDPNVETLNQRTAVQAFFASANQTLQEMSSMISGGEMHNNDQD